MNGIMDMMRGKAIDPARQRMASALRGGGMLGQGGMFGVRPAVSPGPSTPQIDQAPRMRPGAGRGGGGGWEAMPMGQAFTTMLDAIGSAKNGTKMPAGSGQFMIGPAAREHIPGGFKPGQGQAVWKPGTFNLGGKGKKVA